MKKFIVPGLVAGVALLVLSYAVLYLTINLFPNIAEQYYSPVFWPGQDRAILFYLHPFVLSFPLAWFWNRIKSSFKGALLLRGIELGVVYALVATLPAMWITFSAIDVSFTMVLTWLGYGLLQATVCGLIFAALNP
jgi:hypothetical protein